MEGIRVGPSGPIDAKIVIVGEAPGADEELRGEPFVGSSGQELNRMLHEAGILRTECYLTNVSKYRPPNNDMDFWFAQSKKKGLELGYVPFMGEYVDQHIVDSVAELHAELNALQPNIVILLGATALWAVTGKSPITSWRGSIMETLPLGPDGISGKVFKCLPTYHPANILRQWENRPVAVHDLARAFRDSEFPEIRYPAYRFEVRPSYEQVIGHLVRLTDLADQGPVKLAADLETRHGYLACLGLAWSRLEALCIPFMCVERNEGYWTVEQEVEIIARLRVLLTHPNVMVIGQNFGYDTQYTAKEWGIFIVVYFDTMVAQHVIFAGSERGLGYLSSMYCDFHQYWKDEGKEWNPKTTPEDKLWVYNCKDAVITYECHEVLDQLLDATRLREVFNFQMYELWPEVIKMMLRGVAINNQTRAEIAVELVAALDERHAFFFNILGYDLNPRSTPQMRTLFYERLRCEVIKHRKTKQPTLNEDALERTAAAEPLLYPLVDAINEERSLGVFMNTFVKAPLDYDGRMRCFFDITGTETFRFSSKENAFGRGTNLQNIPKGDRSSTMTMPNIRRLFVPDPNFLFAEVDLAGADAQVVAWEANDDVLKEIFRKRLKLHAENAKMLYGGDAGADGRREPYYTRAKQGCHAFNYGSSARTVAQEIGVPVHEAERFKNRWFGIHPAIPEWHRRVEADLIARREVRNKFGYRRFFLDRIQSILPEALAWVPQSTVAIVTNKGLVNIGKHFKPEIVHVSLQVHDSLPIQIRRTYCPHVLPELEKLLLIPIPYDDPLTIPLGLKVSEKSWGDAEDYAWPR